MAKNKQLLNKELFDRLQNVDGNKCLFVQFPNEDNKLAVGYQNWVKKQLSNEELEKKIADQEYLLVEIMWPQANVLRSNAMKKVLAKLPKRVDWTMSAARIIRFGGKLFRIILIIFM